VEAISRQMTISQVILAYPEVSSVFERLGMGCLICMGATEETVEAGARMHGLAVQRLLAELNQCVQKAGARSPDFP
jgi:hybrid cluster-associated redox disulfide protein